jgi:phospholipase C
MSPIKHVIIIVKENHTFDNYFGTFPGADGVSMDHACDPPAGGDPPHTHAAWLNRAQGAVRQQYTESDIPAYFAYARQFTLCDNYFSEVASQSAPNHLMLVCADSPIIDNADNDRTYQPQPPYDLPSLPESLSAAGLSWKSYGGEFNYFNYVKNLKGLPNIVDWRDFNSEITANQFPNVSWLYAPTDPIDLSEHPPYPKNAGQATIKQGMEWTVARINQISQSRYWADCAIFIIWDDWGGWYDHVEPPLKDTWQGGSAERGPLYKDTQFSYGPRVPCLILSPYAKKGVNKTFHSHVSILKFCEINFDLKPLNARDAASDDMSDCFDFTQSPLSPPLWM